MSSVEIVEVINAMRGPGKAELRHADFMEKVRTHPGIAHGNFSGGYFDPNGQVRPCYYLPKREAELMVMSESLEVQTKVYDRLTALEAAVVPKLRLYCYPTIVSNLLYIPRNDYETSSKNRGWQDCVRDALHRRR